MPLLSFISIPVETSSGIKYIRTEIQNGPITNTQIDPNKDTIQLVSAETAQMAIR